MDITFREQVLEKLNKNGHVENEEAVIFTKAGDPIEVLMFAEIIELQGKKYNFTAAQKIRDDQGYWNQIEIYIERHLEAQFSHGICEECAEKLYGDSEWYQKRKKKGGLKNSGDRMPISEMKTGILSPGFSIRG